MQRLSPEGGGRRPGAVLRGGGLSFLTRKRTQKFKILVIHIFILVGFCPHPPKKKSNIAGQMGGGGDVGPSPGGSGEPL